MPLSRRELSFLMSTAALVIEKTPDCIRILFLSKYPWMRNILLFSNRISQSSAHTSALTREGIHLHGADDTVPSWGARNSYITTQAPALGQNTSTDVAILWQGAVAAEVMWWIHMQTSDVKGVVGPVVNMHAMRLPYCRWGPWTGLWSEVPFQASSTHIPVFRPCRR